LSALCGAAAFFSAVPAAVGDPLPTVVVGVAHEALTGSSAAPDAESSFVGALLLASKNDGWQYLCSGTLITPTVVVTAAHCLTEALNDPTILGFTNTRQLANPPQPAARATAVAIDEAFVGRRRRRVAICTTLVSYGTVKATAATSSKLLAK